MKLLVVEGEALVRRQLQRSLSRSRSCSAVEAVATGEEALTHVGSLQNSEKIVR